MDQSGWAFPAFRFFYRSRESISLANVAKEVDRSTSRSLGSNGGKSEVSFNPRPLFPRCLFLAVDFLEFSSWRFRVKYSRLTLEKYFFRENKIISTSGRDGWKSFSLINEICQDLKR